MTRRDAPSNGAGSSDDGNRLNRYSIGTWDTDAQAYTPQVGVPAFNLTRAQLVLAIRELRDCGYTVHRFGNIAAGHDDNDGAVLIERTDGMTEAEILERWKR